jgi:ATP-binding cassette subfamily C protein
MRSADCSTDPRGVSAAAPSPVSPSRRRRLDLLRALASIVGRRGAILAGSHVLLSLLAALTGSVAAIVLVPLIQSGHAPMFGGHVLVLPTSTRTLLSLFVMATACHVLLRWFVSGLGARIISDCAMRLRGSVHARLVDADVVALNGLSSAEIANVLTANVELVTQGVGATLQLLVAGVTTAINLAVAFWVSPVLALMLPALAALGLVALRWHGREQSRISREYVEDTTRLFWFSEDFPRRLRHVRSFEREEAEKAGYGAASARLARAYRRQIELTASGKLVVELLATTGMVAIFLIAGRWHGVDQASLVAVGLLLGRLLPYMSSTRHNFQQLRLAVPAFELWRRYATLDRVQWSVPPAMDAGAAVRRIAIERVRLQLSSLRVEVENLVLAPGEMTVVAGDSGIGKTSLVDVLAGMTAPVFFAAHVDGRCVDFDAYRQLVRKGAYVSQSIRPWQRTVRECLSWVAPGSTDECLHQVLADVGLDTRLQGVRDGLDLEVRGSSCRLSGGELQRVLLAQVILRQPFVAVLDEATGALDAASEMKVLETLKRRLPQTILIVVSHRHGPLDLADQCVHMGQAGRARVVKTAMAEA